jgi:hypothetical protein
MRHGLGNSPRTLDIIAVEIDRQLVLNLGGEPLAGSGFEVEIPETDFDERS